MYTLVASVVARTDDGILLVREGKENVEGTWNLPGGRVEANEDPADTAVREFAEEVDVGVELGGLVGVYLGRDAFVEGPFLSIAYQGEVSEEPRVVPTDTVEAVEWVDQHRIDDFELRSSYIPRAISDASERKLPKNVIRPTIE